MDAASELADVTGCVNDLRFGAVAIGRNEGDRLKRCIESLSVAASVVYVDSGSTDESVQWARNKGADVVELDRRSGFTAARARNAGFARLRELAPGLRYVQFVDGDCELREGWPGHALRFLQAHPNAGAVCGRRRERFPNQSVYNWLCDEEWNTPPGEARACGGDAMLRVDALASVDGYREDLIAGEEPELCVRLRAAGWRIWRLDREMTFHDAAMTHFSQWWRRALRSGYAFAQGARLHGEAPERHWVWESRRAWIWGLYLPLACFAAGFAFPWGWTTWLIFPLQMLRQTARNKGPLRDRLTMAFFQILARFAEACGQIKFVGTRLAGAEARLIEYK